MSARKNKRKQIIALTVAALVALPGTLLYTQQAISNQSAPQKQAQQPDAPSVSVVDVTAQSYHSKLAVFGEVRAVDSIALSSEIGGAVVWRNPAFHVGARVRAGDELIRLDDTSYQSALASAKQALAQANLTLHQEKRQKAQALKDWKRSGLREKPSALLLREPQLRVAYASYHAAKAALVQAEQNLAKTTLRAPFDAVVLSRSAALGSYLSAGSAVAQLNASARAEIELALSAAQWRQLPADPRGTAVTLTAESAPGASWQGEVRQLSQRIDSATRLRTLVVSVEAPLDRAEPLLFGSFVQAQFTGESVPNLLALPTTALSAGGYLWTVNDKQLARSRREIVFSQGDTVFVKAGDLQGPIQVVRNPLSSYLPGMQVSPSSDVQLGAAL